MRSMHVPHLLYDRERREFLEDCAVVFEIGPGGEERCAAERMDPEETTHRRLERRVGELEAEVERLKAERGEMWKRFGKEGCDGNRGGESDHA